MCLLSYILKLFFGSRLALSHPLNSDPSTWGRGYLIETGAQKPFVGGTVPGGDLVQDGCGGDSAWGGLTQDGSPETLRGGQAGSFEPQDLSEVRSCWRSEWKPSATWFGEETLGWISSVETEVNCER